MPKARQSTGPPNTPLTPMADRVRRLLDLRWAGKQRQMAADLGVSQAAISRIVRGTQAVGPRMLATIGAHCGVNADWLRTGLGEPLLDPALQASAGDWLAPVAKVILPGTPVDHSGLLAGERLAVANAYRRPTRYIFIVGPEHPIVRDEGAKVAPGDQLLIETDRGLWLKNRRVLAGKLVALRLGGENGGDFVLASAGMHPTTREWKFTSFGVLGPPAPTSAAGTPDVSESSGKPYSAPRYEASGTGASTAARAKNRGIMLRRTESSGGPPVMTDPVQTTPPTEPVPNTPEETQVALPSIEDVVGYCVLLVRT